MHKVLPRIPDYQVTVLFQIIKKILLNHLNERALHDRLYISDAILYETVLFWLRDLYKLDYQQRGNVSLSKYAGYLGFWVRKLKPVSNAFPSENTEPKAEITNINEIIALDISISVIIHELRQDDKSRSFLDTLSIRCEKCPGQSNCFSRYVKHYFSYNGRAKQHYLTYSMRSRTFGPHHFVNELDHLIYASCPHRLT